jgi:DNA-binding transcriptional regulator YiaG
VRDRPDCPRCFAKPDPAALESDAAKIDDFRRLIALKPAEAAPSDLKKMRVQAGLTLGQAARLLGIERATLAACEAGLTQLGQEEASKMSELYECGNTEPEGNAE